MPRMLPESLQVNPEPKFEDSSGIRLAVNLDDLDRVPTDLRGPLLAGRLDLDRIIKHAGRDRGSRSPAVEFACGLLAAAAIIDLVRAWDRDIAGETEIKAYISRGATWMAIPFDQQLTLMINGKPVFNPALFGRQAIPMITESAPAEVRPLTIGKRSG